ncbi:type II secretion system GspH family protein [Patescibacteria group bacterium]|nr:type II secretion system GspH family protein [Patescibacteria group bacterium]
MSITSKKTAKGFTLIELLVVIAIIGILSSVVLASLNTARLKSRDTRRIADVKQIQLALALYFDSVGEYPDALSQLAPQYIAVIPTEPDGDAYAYDNLLAPTGGACAEASGSCAYYHLGAVLEEATNQALDGDADLGVSATFGFDGNDANCDTSDGTGTDACFDVTP